MLTGSSFACDICGCGVGGSYIGILPDFNKKIIGLRYRMSSIKTHLGIGGSPSYLTTNERYQVAELWSAVNITRKTRLMLTVPYNFNEQQNQSGTVRKNGLGDISLTGFYNIINSRRPAANNKLLIQSLWLGAGIKLPTGKYQPANRESIAGSPNVFQLGTGSTDFTLTAMYDIRLQDIGLNVNSSYKINTTNKYEYGYGNKLSINTQLYHKFTLWKNGSIAPNAGILFEQSENDTDNKYRVDISGGNIMMGTIGTELNIKKIMLGFNWQTPLRQNLARQIVKSGNKAMLHVAFAL